ncbi:MAG: TPM domain-containing protein [Lachnospiraceae bacterium]|nr:TPM domain-containing protein [Lachnospiraceae bacterium]
MRMKRVFFLILAMMLLLMTGVAAAQSQSDSEKAPVSADGQYYDFNRIVDVTNSLTDEERAEINKCLAEFIEGAKLDLQIYIIPSAETFGCESVAEFADRYFDDPKYPSGYGAERLSLFYIYETDNGKSELYSYGRAKNQTTWGVMKAKFYADYYMQAGNVYDACYGLIDRVWKDLDKSHTIRAARNDMMNPSGFHPFHNETVSRVLDYADLLNDEQRKAMEERLTKIRETYHMDIVVLTAPDSDGKVWEDFADDFYDYGGFGYGEDYDGMILFVDMDPADRGYTITTCGTRGQNLYNGLVETIYDDMFDYFKSAQYYDGINVYINHAVRQINHVELPSSFEGIERSQIGDATDAARVISQDGILKESVQNKLEKAIKSIRREYKTDVLVLAVNDTGDYYPVDYLYNYYTFNGYGEGGKRSGVGLILVDGDTDPAKFELLTFGGTGDKFDEAAVERLSSMVSSALGSDKFDRAAEKFVDKVEFRLKWGHYPLRTSTTIVLFVIVFIVISIIASIKKAANKTISKAVTASEYMVPGSYRIFNIEERFINSKVTKTRRPEPSSTGRSGGGGGGSHHSSSGRSHGGGGGRHF